MNFDLTAVQADARERGSALGREVAGAPAADAVMRQASRAGLLERAADLLSVACAVAAVAEESAAAGVTLALHSGTALAIGASRFPQLYRGETVAAVGLSSEDIPTEEGGRLSGRAPWVAPITTRGIAVVGPRRDGGRAAYAVALDGEGVTVETVETAGLAGLVCGHLTLRSAPCEPVGGTLPIMTRVRILIAAAGLGIGRRALREALAAARTAHTATSGEQTVQGLLADTATELDAAMLMTWKAALGSPLSLADASHAKLMVTGAAQRAVERATQVIGADSFQRGHVIERLAQDVRALELFAGRTEALRAAIDEGQSHASDIVGPR